jgi:hypothetical protein
LSCRTASRTASPLNASVPPPPGPLPDNRSGASAVNPSPASPG